MCDKAGFLLEIATYPSSPSKSKQRSNHTVLSRALSKLNLHARSGPRLGPGFRRRRRQVAREEPASPPGQAAKLQSPLPGHRRFGTAGRRGIPELRFRLQSRGTSTRAEWEPARVAAGTVGAKLEGREAGSWHPGGGRRGRACGRKGVCRQASRVRGCERGHRSEGGDPGAGRGTRRGGNWGAHR